MSALTFSLTYTPSWRVEGHFYKKPTYKTAKINLNAFHILAFYFK